MLAQALAQMLKPVRGIPFPVTVKSLAGQQGPGSTNRMLPISNFPSKCTSHSPSRP